MTDKQQWDHAIKFMEDTLKEKVKQGSYLTLYGCFFHLELVFKKFIQILTELNCDTFIYCTALYTVWFFVGFFSFNLITISLHLPFSDTQ